MEICSILLAAIELISPIGGETVSLLPEAQKSIMAIETYDGRLAALKGDAVCGGKKYSRDPDEKWRTSAPLVLKWRATAGEKGPWRIAMGTDASLSGANVWWSESEVKKTKGADGTVCEWTVPRPNLELGKRYYWKVYGDVKCPGGYSHGSMMSGKCATCGKESKPSESKLAEFVADPQPPRWIEIEGRVKNMRDIGGWKTVDGRRVKQGMVFRGQGLNDNSQNGEKPGRNRLMVEDVAFLKDKLGIKTDLDLRTGRETAAMGASPLGAGVAYVHRPSPAYAGIFARPGANDDWLGSDGKKTMAENFRLFCDERNYPIYFHCIGGADRTGSLAYVLNGVLGVPKHSLDVDWESTFYPTLPEMEKNYNGPTFWRREQYFDEGFAKYGDEGATWNERIRLYLLDCGVTQEEIDRFRSIMLE